ncbi:MAG TPA: hypothetical protein VI758_14205 [Bacteroidota bacterium]
MVYRRPIQRFAVAVFVLMFMADAINIDEMMGLTSFEREEDLAGEFASARFNSGSTKNHGESCSFSTNASKSHKPRLELFDEDSPSLGATYVSRDSIVPMLREEETFLVPVSPSTNSSLHSLCKLQI